MTYEDATRGDAVKDLLSAFRASIEKIMATHGNDPDTEAIIAAAIVKLILHCEENRNSEFRKVMIYQLEKVE